MAGDRALLAHLLRRAGFGARPDELDRAVAAGYQATVERLLQPIGPDQGAAATPPPQLSASLVVPKKDDTAARLAALRKIRADRSTLITWWVHRMVATEHPLTEKMVFFWHGHWATSLQKVKYPVLLQRQLGTLRSHALGDFGAMAAAMVRDPALNRWLDNHRNARRAPNENLARELMELFILGVGHYTEDDVKQAARALTGFVLDRDTGELRLVRRRHDGDVKTVLGTTGRLDADSLVAVLIGQPAAGPHVLGRLWARFGGPGRPPTSTMTRMLAAYGPRRDLRAAVRAMLLDPGFTSADVRGALVKQPVEYVVGALRSLRLTPEALATERAKNSYTPVLTALRRLGQVPLLPPSVVGWPEGTAWLSTAATRARLGFAIAAAGAADLSAIADEPARQRLDATAHLFAVDRWTPATRTALGSIDDPEKLVTSALLSPEVVLC